MSYGIFKKYKFEMRMPTTTTVNGNVLFFEVSADFDQNTYQITVSGKSINIEKFGLSHTFTLSQFGVDQGGHISTKIKFPVFSLSFPCVT